MEITVREFRSEDTKEAIAIWIHDLEFLLEAYRSGRIAERL